MIMNTSWISHFLVCSMDDCYFYTSVIFSLPQINVAKAIGIPPDDNHILVSLIFFFIKPTLLLQRSNTGFKRINHMLLYTEEKGLQSNGDIF